jgi:hypothetical protein
MMAAVCAELRVAQQKPPIRVDVEAAVAVIFGKAKTALNTRSTAASSPTSPSLPELHKLTAQNTNWQ